MYNSASIPVSVQTGDGGLPVAVQVLRLLQEDVVEDPGDVDGDIVLYGLKHCHVGPHAGQQLAGFGDLLGSLVVHGHPHYGPRAGQKTVRHQQPKSNTGIYRSEFGGHSIFFVWPCPPHSQGFSQQVLPLKCVFVYLVNRISRCEVRYSLGVNVCSHTTRLGT